MIDDANGDSNLSFVYQFAKIYLIIFVKELNVWLTVVAETNHVQVSVRDEGPGLSEQDQKLLFGRFAKLTPRPTAGEHSTGLGLSIVKQLVELMHGTIICRSEQGQGTTFTVSLPQAAL